MTTKHDPADEDLWAKYAAAALTGRIANEKPMYENYPEYAARQADEMVQLHRKRFPRRENEGPYR